jgi:hypothetical protein
MANVSRVNGLRPVKHIDGSPWNGQLNRYFVAAADGTAIFQGDLVTLAATSDTQGQTVIPGVPSIGGTQGVTKAAVVAAPEAVPCVGVACGFSINPLNLNSPQYRAASTAMYVLVSDAPDTVYEVQSSAILTDFNLNTLWADAGGSTVTGQSGITVGVTAGTSAATTLKLVGASQKVDNDITSVNAKVLVVINNHQYAGGTGTAGV